MNKTRKSQKKNKRKVSKKRCTFKRSRVPPKRVNIVKGGAGNLVFPATFSNDLRAASPQSYYPYNDFSNDPNYSVVSSRNTGPFLTGVASGGSRRRRKVRGGGGDGSLLISNAMNSATNSIGIMPLPAINETSGAAGVMSGFSNNAAAYDPSPANIAPLA